MPTRDRVIALTIPLLTVLVPLLQAQGWIEPARPLPRGGIEKVRSAVQVSLTGRIARVTVEEWFRNTGPLADEGSYLYPLPGEAAFSDFSLWQGDRELKGETMDAAQARSIYEAIVRLKRDPALIELVGHGVLRARIFPINPGETRKITLRYTQILDRLGDAWRFRYAGGAGPAPRSFRLEADSAARFGDPYSPTHRVTTTRSADRLTVALADSSWSGELELLLPLARGLVGMSLLATRPAGEDGYFMLLLAPGAGGQTEALRRDVVAVLDVSGSMSGEKLDQAKAALLQLLATLRRGDRFRLVAFASGVRRYTTGWADVSPQSIRDAQEWVRALGGEGGTNIADALSEAFAAPPADGELGVVVFLTDGMPTVGESDPERIADQAERSRGRFRVFSFGIGYDVNTYLLDRLTERARGVTEYIRPGGDIERAVSSLAAKIANPVLTDLAVSAGGVELYDTQPANLPDLFAGEELALFGRYRGAGSGEWSMTVRGRRNGHEEQFTTGVGTRDAQSANDYIRQLWATRKAGALAREIRLHGQSAELVNSLKELALRYGILTEYTAYLVQEPGAVAGRPTGPLAPAPAMQVGEASVAQARREAKSAAAAVIADAAETDVILGARSGIAPTQRVGGRLFILRNGTWTDLGHGDSLRIVTVEPFSDAYFALLRALPELVKPAALTPAVLVAGRRVSINIQPGGKKVWAGGELDRVVREFRS